jgi:cbb3-type cytochrome oxidase cytochrome c subunit
MMEMKKRKDLMPKLHLTPAQRQLYEVRKRLQLEDPSRMVKEPIMPTYKFKTVLPISGENTEKFQAIRAKLKRHRNSTIKPSETKASPKSPSHSTIKKQPQFLRNNKDNTRSQSLIKP